MSAQVIQLYQEPNMDMNFNSGVGADEPRFDVQVQGKILSLNYDEAYELALELARMIQNCE